MQAVLSTDTGRLNSDTSKDMHSHTCLVIFNIRKAKLVFQLNSELYRRTCNNIQNAE